MRGTDLTAVIAWLEAGCDPAEAAKELRSYQEALSSQSLSLSEAREEIEAERELLDKALTVLNRCYHVLNNMQLENDGLKSFFWRWQISDEPLRHDARNLLPLINEVLGDD